jgi:hypothetical protein
MRHAPACVQDHHFGRHGCEPEGQVQKPAITLPDEQNPPGGRDLADERSAAALERVTEHQPFEQRIKPADPIKMPQMGKPIIRSILLFPSFVH